MLNYNQIACSWEGRGHVSRAQTFVFHGRQCVMGQVGSLKYALRASQSILLVLKAILRMCSILFTFRAGFLLPTTGGS